jgi:hypothetical protein
MGARRSVKVAYGLYAWTALMVCAFDLQYLPIDTSYKLPLVMLVVFPLLTLSILLWPIAIVISLIHWREWPLLVMSASLVVVLGVHLVEEADAFVGEYGSLALLNAVGITMVFFCVRWFTVGRRRVERQPGA